ncbi:MAG: RHS repeat-associated core domain-containing protein [Parabacteroides sp.]|nr:RHS repeat-associated core domain-containing protein [Parabacteroides sp.]
MVNAGSGGVHFPAYDLNGNVMGLVNATNGIISAKYEYGPFGEVFCSVGDMAKVNPFQFSTKYTDSETDLVYYGYRYYSPALGRWLSRDPIEERGGLNLYGFVNNDPVNKWDKLGLISDERMYRRECESPRKVRGPRIYDHFPPGFLGGLDSLEADNTAWFEEHYPGWIAQMKWYFTGLINIEVKRKCGKKGFRAEKEKYKMSVNPYHNRMCGGLWLIKDPEENETLYGDIHQSWFSSAYVLHEFKFEVDDIVSIQYKQHESPCFRYYTWTTSLKITDYLGFQEGDSGYFLAKWGIFPDRKISRATWTISGEGECCINNK